MKVSTGSLCGRAIVHSAMKGQVVVVGEAIGHKICSVPVFGEFHIDVASIEITTTAPVAFTHIVGSEFPEIEIAPTAMGAPQIAVSLAGARLITNRISCRCQKDRQQKHTEYYDFSYDHRRSF